MNTAEQTFTVDSSAGLKPGDVFFISNVRKKKPWWRFWERQKDYPIQYFTVSEVVNSATICVSPDITGGPDEHR